jgi:hypothetical protein
MTRGEALRTGLAPLIAANIDLLDDHVADRFYDMCEKYRIPI